jgi:hypothetical protein
MEIGRLAFRQEGAFWNAFWAPNQHNMDKALLIGSIRLSVVEGRIREDFMDLMKASFDNIVKDKMGRKPTWGAPKAAPENERGGNA